MQRVVWPQWIQLRNLRVLRERDNGVRQQFQVVYETKGVKVVNVWLPEGTELPADWHTITYAEQDEWLYNNQDEAHLQWTDETEGQAVNVLPVAQLKAVWVSLY